MLATSTQVVLVGLVVTTYQGHALQSFRLRASTDLNNPGVLTGSVVPGLQPGDLAIWSSSANWSEAGILQRTFRLPEPVLTTRVRLDKLKVKQVQKSVLQI